MIPGTSTHSRGFFPERRNARKNVQKECNLLAGMRGSSFSHIWEIA
jgi:hypothetical protein